MKPSDAIKKARTELHAALRETYADDETGLAMAIVHVFNTLGQLQMADTSGRCQGAARDFMAAQVEDALRDPREKPLLVENQNDEPPIEYEWWPSGEVP